MGEQALDYGKSRFFTLTLFGHILLAPHSLGHQEEGIFTNKMRRIALSKLTTLRPTA